MTLPGAKGRFQYGTDYRSFHAVWRMLLVWGFRYITIMIYLCINFFLLELKDLLGFSFPAVFAVFFHKSFAGIFRFFPTTPSNSK